MRVLILFALVTLTFWIAGCDPCDSRPHYQHPTPEHKEAKP